MMKTLVVNGKELKYVGLPLNVTVFDGKYYSGRTNFLCSNEKIKTEIDLMDLEDCFRWMKTWSAMDDYIHGYVLDYSTKTIYYDKQEALDHLFNLVFPIRQEENFFEHFTQKDFSA